jgi:hypothetical protein
VVLRYNGNADWANFHGFFPELGTEFQKKSVRIRPIRVIRVPIVSKTTRRKVYITTMFGGFETLQTVDKRIFN